MQLAALTDEEAVLKGNELLTGTESHIETQFCFHYLHRHKEVICLVVEDESVSPGCLKEFKFLDFISLDPKQLWIHF